MTKSRFLVIFLSISILLFISCKSEEKQSPCLNVGSNRSAEDICDEPKILPEALAHYQAIVDYLEYTFTQSVEREISKDTLVILSNLIDTISPLKGEEFKFWKLKFYQYRSSASLSQGDYEAALEDTRVVQDILKNINWGKDCIDYHLGISLSRIALIYLQQSKFESAEVMMKDGIDIGLKIRNWSGLATDYQNLGFLYSYQGEPSLAIANLKKALCIWGQLDLRSEDSLRVAWTYNTLAYSMMTKGDSLIKAGNSKAALSLKETAIDQYKGNLSFFKEFSSRDHASFITYTALNIAYDYSMREDISYADSTKKYVAIAMRSSNKLGDQKQILLKAAAYRHLGYAAARSGNCQEAVMNINKSIKLLETNIPGLAETIVNYENEHLNFHFSKGAILKICALVNDNNTKTLEKSLEAYTEAFDLFDNLRREIIFNGSLESSLALRIDHFSYAVEIAFLLYQKNKNNKYYLDKAFEVMRRSKGYTLNQGIYEKIMQIEQKKAKNPIYQTYQALLEGYKTLKGQSLDKNHDQTESLRAIRKKQNDLNEFINDLKQSKSPRKRAFYEARVDQSIPSIKSIQSYLPNETGVIEYAIVSEKIWIFLTTKDNSHIVPIDITDDFFILVKNYNRSLTENSERQHFRKNSARLFSYLIEPILDSLPEATDQLIIIPDQKIADVPFESLILSPKDDKTGLTPTGYLGLEYSIVNHYSISALLRSYYLSEQRSEASLALSVLSSNLPDNKYESCGSFLLEQMNGLNKDLERKNWSSNEFVRQKEFATKDDFFQIAPNSKIVQLALHGCKEKMGGNYQLEFYPSSRSEQFLTLPEIYELNLKSDLLVLSNCNTAQGEPLAGEGLNSLARAFTYAGCKGVIATVSQVSDEYTADILRLFYKYLLEENRPPPIALMMAKREYMLKGKEELHISQWNNIIYIGDPMASWNSPLKSL